MGPCPPVTGSVAMDGAQTLSPTSSPVSERDRGQRCSEGGVLRALTGMDSGSAHVAGWAGGSGWGRVSLAEGAERGAL